MKRFALSLGVPALVAVGGWWLARPGLGPGSGAPARTHSARTRDVAANSSAAERGQANARGAPPSRAR